MGNLFENLSDKEKRKLLYTLKADMMSAKKNTSLLKEIRGNMIGIVLEGVIEIIRTHSNGISSIVERVEDEDIFSSSLSFIDNEDYDVIAKEDSIILLVNINDISGYQESHRGYYQKFMKNLFILLIEKMKERNERVQLLTEKSIRDKLLSYFKILSTKSNSKVIYIPYTLGYLADYLAVNRSALMRELKALQDEKLIISKNKRIRLLY